MNCFPPCFVVMFKLEILQLPWMISTNDFT